MSNQTLVCRICGKELTNQEINLLSEWDFQYTCMDHREYRSMFNSEVCQAIAGFPTGFSPEQVELFKINYNNRKRTNEKIKEAFDTAYKSYTGILFFKHYPDRMNEKIEEAFAIIKDFINTNAV